MYELWDSGLIVSTGLLILCFKKTTQHIRQSVTSAGNLDGGTGSTDANSIVLWSPAPEVQLLSAKRGLLL